jgi:hypothetical protein
VADETTAPIETTLSAEANVRPTESQKNYCKEDEPTMTSTTSRSSPSTQTATTLTTRLRCRHPFITPSLVRSPYRSPALSDSSALTRDRDVREAATAASTPFAAAAAAVFFKTRSPAVESLAAAAAERLFAVLPLLSSPTALVSAAFRIADERSEALDHAAAVVRPPMQSADRRGLSLAVPPFVGLRFFSPSFDAPTRLFSIIQ